MGRMDYPFLHLYQPRPIRNKLFNDMQSDIGLEINPQQIFELAMKGRYGVANERIINSPLYLTTAFAPSMPPADMPPIIAAVNRDDTAT
jgi:hypothetical protein